ncbi:hypothetical protein GmHk_01G001081 [Glycine max]|nr:hypothetical protein GmHk_01G001081 [Glycine max]
MPRVGEVIRQEETLQDPIKKCLMSTWEDLDDTSSDEGEEEANLCSMVDTTSKEYESNQEDKVNLDDPESLKKAYHELPSNSYVISKAYKNLQKDFKRLSKDHMQLDKILQDKVELCFENDAIAKEKSTLLENFQELEKKLKGLQKDLKELNELHNHQSQERYDLWTEYAQAHKYYENLKIRSTLRYGKFPSNRSNNGYDQKIYVHNEDIVVFYFCGKVGHMTSKCRDRPRISRSNAFKANTKEP